MKTSFVGGNFFKVYTPVFVVVYCLCTVPLKKINFFFFVSLVIFDVGFSSVSENDWLIFWLAESRGARFVIQTLLLLLLFSLWISRLGLCFLSDWLYWFGVGLFSSRWRLANFGTKDKSEVLYLRGFSWCFCFLLVSFQVFHTRCYRN